MNMSEMVGGDPRDACNGLEEYVQAGASEDEAPYEVTLQVFPRDIEQLVVSSMRWNNGEVEPDEPWASHRGRFENMTGPHDPDYHPAAKWKMIYWVDSGDWSGVMLIRAFLEAQCFLYEIAADTVGGEYVVLTDYETPGWRKRREEAAG